FAAALVVGDDAGDVGGVDDRLRQRAEADILPHRQAMTEERLHRVAGNASLCRDFVDLELAVGALALAEADIDEQHEREARDEEHGQRVANPPRERARACRGTGRGAGSGDAAHFSSSSICGYMPCWRAIIALIRSARSDRIRD